VRAVLGCDPGAPPATGDAGPASDTGPDCTGRAATGPSTRGELGGVYDAARNRVVIFGGNVLAPVNCIPMAQMTNEVWAFELDCRTWVQITPGGDVPSVRSRPAVTLDAAHGRMFVFGGRDRSPSGTYTNYADVYIYDLATDTWSAFPTSGVGPSPRSSAAIAYDEVADRLLVFGGNTSTSGLMLTGAQDLFSLDLATGAWTDLTPATGGPGPRLMHAGVVAGRQWLVFGGTPAFNPPYWNDTWALDLDSDTWTLVDDGSGTAPSTRFGHELFWDAGRMFVFGGHDQTNLGNQNDVWALETATGTWTQIRPGDAPNAPSAGFCDFPSDFTIPEVGAPERRYGFARAQGPGTGYVLAGKTDCGNIDDVWGLDFASGGWTLLRPATSGEACNRSGRTGCTSLCN